ncbi:MAG TPA: NrfD/PsrC family molybdoenzyme membrane anchor subunit [Vicinamibacterales bacterium]|nr:NrfD/PsrC family molybdoenzyme membrane anchor subunit [Vicinamibacterales bacterium]
MADGYHGLPLLKPPVWTWEVPAYFFVGGAAGAAALIAEISRLAGDEDAVWRDARWIAAAGGAMSAPLLIADLGRPERFLNMLRVFKPQSPMSVGVWIVLGFSNASAAALAGQLWQARARHRLPAQVLTNISGPLAAAAGVGMVTYTGVLLGATAVPVWARNVRLLPIHFAFSGLGTATSLLQLRHPRSAPLRRLGIAASAVETAVGARLESAAGRASEPLKHGPSGGLMRAAGLLSGPVPLLLRTLGRRSPAAQRLAALSTIAGSLLTRYAWVAAGRASAKDPAEPLALPAKHSPIAKAD